MRKSEKVNVTGCGSVLMEVDGGGDKQRLKPDNVLHVPFFELSLISVKVLEKKNL